MLKQMKEQDIEEVINIHLTCFPKDNSVKLGKLFLKRFYKDILKEKNNFGFIKVIDNKIVGFIIGLQNRKEILKKDGFGLFICLLPNLFNIKTIKFLIGNLKHQSLGKEYPELFNLAVLPKYRGHKIAQELLNKLLKRFKEQGVKTIQLTTASDNKVANHIYKKFGFKLYKQFTIANEKRNKYIYNLEGG